MSDEDREATLFAIHLLMPEKMVREAISKMQSFDIADDRKMQELAKKFQVPASLMAIRIGMLMEKPLN